MSDKDIPHRNTFRNEILRRAHLSEGKVCEKFKVLPCKISFTFDASTSERGDPYLSITGHYIDAPVDRPNEWELKSEQLAFQEIEGRHTGKNIAQILSRSIEWYGIWHGKVSCIKIYYTLFTDYSSQVGWMTSDGASVNRTTIREFGRLLTDADGDWSAEEHDML